VLQVEARNEAALGHCFKMGYRVTEQVRYLKVLGWRRRRSVPAEGGGETAGGKADGA
jgi:hypothetical protein